MNCRIRTSRREALGLGSAAAFALAGGGRASAEPRTGANASGPRVPDEELSRVAALYAGEFGGCRGVR